MQFSFLDSSRGSSFDVGHSGVISTVLGWLTADQVLGLWSGTLSLNSVQRNSQALYVDRILLVSRSEILQMNTVLMTQSHGSVLSALVKSNTGVFLMLISVLTMTDFENALISYSFTVARHHVVLWNVVLLIEFALSVDYHIIITEILHKKSSPRYLSECLNVLLSLCRTASDVVWWTSQYPDFQVWSAHTWIWHLLLLILDGMMRGLSLSLAEKKSSSELSSYLFWKIAVIRNTDLHMWECYLRTRVTL